jgi:integrase
MQARKQTGKREMMKYVPRRDIPDIARELRTLSPSKIADRILAKRNVKRTTQSVNMWFKDHQDIYFQLTREIVEGASTERQAVNASLFEYVTFREIPSVREWILYMKTRRGRKGKPLHPHYIKAQIWILRRACREYEKHPDRLTFRDAQEIFLAMEEKGKESYHFRRAVKDFLKSKGVSDWEKIGVGKPRSYGKYRDLFVPKNTILQMLQYIKTLDFSVYVLDQVMWHNGLRLNAIRLAQIEKFHYETGQKWGFITVLEKFREEKTFMLPVKVARLLNQVIGDKREGNIFHLKEDYINKVNRDALRKFVPQLEPKIEMPSHFFRHMFFQHLLRACHWNYAIAAAIGQTTIQSLMESYGGAPPQQVAQWCKQYLPRI